MPFGYGPLGDEPYGAPPAVGAVLAATEPTDQASFGLMPGWPAGLPKPTLAGYGLHPNASVQRLAMEIGAARVYRRTKRPLADVSVMWICDHWQQMMLDGFRTSIVEDGGAWFDVELAFPVGLRQVTARFKDKFTPAPAGGRYWRISGTLEVLQRPVMSDDDLTALLDDEGDDPVWPASLPKPLQSSWTLEPKPVVARSDDLPGLPQQRRRSRNSVTEAPQARWELTAEQAAIFDAFFVHRGMSGARWFDFPMFSGIGTVETKVRFMGDVDWTPRARGWSVVAPIEIRERQVVTPEEYAWLVGEDPDALFAAVAALHGVIHDEVLQ
jgi:hypothetical protein